MKRFLFIAFVLVGALSSTAFSQNMLSTSSHVDSFANISNFPDCSTGGVNCWHANSGWANTIFSANGRTIATTSTYAYTYNPYPVNAWTAQTAWGLGIMGAWYDLSGNLYALISNATTQSHCSGGTYPGYYLYSWSGTAWTYIAGCFWQMSPPSNAGNFWVAVDVWGYMWTTSNVNGAWTQFTTNHVLSAASSIASSSTYYAIKTNHTVWKVVGTTWTQISGMSNAAQVVTGRDGTIFVLGTDGYVYHYSGSGSAWDKLNGSGNTFLADGGTGLDVWTIGPSNSKGGNIARFSNAGLKWARTYNGTVSCNIPPPNGQQICSQYTHNVALKLQWGATVGHEVTSQFQGPGNWGSTASVNKNDIFDCFDDPTSDACLMREDEGHMQCSGGGGNTDSPPAFNPTFEMARSRVLATSHTADWTGWLYHVIDHCDTLDPDLQAGINMPDELGEIPGQMAFDVATMCFSWDGHQPWMCFDAGGAYVEKTYNTDPGDRLDCTSNP